MFVGKNEQVVQGIPTGKLNDLDKRVKTLETTPPSSAWGSITGTLSEQTDLNTALSGKSDTSHNHAGVYEPADATILKDADIGVSVASQGHNHTGTYAPALGIDDNYVTDAEKTKLANLSGTNTGDQTSIVGITGTKAQFDTAVTDGNFMYTGDAPTAHSHAISDVTSLQTALDNKLDDTQFSGLTKITVGTSTPVAPSTGDLWVDTN